MAFWKNKNFFVFLVAFCTVALFTLGENVFEPWQLRLADNLYGLNKPSPDIVIVQVDDKSLDASQGLGPVTDWSRNNYAQVLENINKHHPRLVAFDVFFKDAKDAKGDLRLRDALAKTKNALIAFASNPERYSEKGYFLKVANRLSYLPLELFRNVPGINLALINILNDSDTVLRRIFPVIFDNQRNTFDESLYFTAVRKVLNALPLDNNPMITPDYYEITLSDQKKLKIPFEHGQMLINFFSNPEEPNYKSVSFVDVYHERYAEDPQKLFENKIVLIGATSRFIDDSYFTPVNKKVKMPGVHIHANAIQTILDQKFLRNMTGLERATLLLTLCFSAAFIFMFTKIRWSVLFLGVTAGLYTLAAPLAFRNGLIVDLVSPYVALVTVFVAIYMYRYLTEFKEKTTLKNAFSKYVNPAVIEQIMADPEQLKLGGARREVTVLFTDIAHFTSIAEDLKPESLVALLNEYFEAMSAIILSEGGTLDKFEGDAIMAFFGAPLAQPDHAVRACRVALKMRYKLYELLQKWENDPSLPGGEKKPQIDFRCGLSTGEVIVGNMGSTERLEYTVMGDIVNLGSRLEGANKKYSTHIMISEATYQKVKDRFEARELDTIRVVGKKHPIKVYELLADKGALPENAMQLLQLYNEAMQLYHERKFEEALAKFNEILKIYTTDGPSKIYRERCEFLHMNPPKDVWDEVFDLETK
jgi:adenylate cyclase